MRTAASADDDTRRRCLPSVRRLHLPALLTPPATTPVFGRGASLLVLGKSCGSVRCPQARRNCRWDERREVRTHIGPPGCRPGVRAIPRNGAPRPGERARTVRELLLALSERRALPRQARAASSDVPSSVKRPDHVEPPGCHPGVRRAPRNGAPRPGERARTVRELLLALSERRALPRQARAASSDVLFSVSCGYAEVSTCDGQNDRPKYPWKSWGTLRPEKLILIPVFRSESSHHGFFAKDFVYSLDDPTDYSVRIGRANEDVM